MMNKTVPLSAFAALGLLSFNAHAAGLATSQIATVESVGSAGVAGVTNHRDASATITNPAALSGIDTSSAVVGIQYVNVQSEFARQYSELSTESRGALWVPNLSYARRLNEDSVVGLSLHSPGGLGVDYSNGVSANPLNLLESNQISVVNLTAAASHQMTERLALGASVIAQYASLEMVTKGGNIKGDSISPTFGLSAFYQATDTINLGVNYVHNTQHSVSPNQNLIGDAAINWPASLDLGISKALSENVTLQANVGWQSWSNYDDGYQDTFSTGVAIRYTRESWLYYSGVSYDSSPVEAHQRDTLLPLDEQWRIGLGAEKQLSSGSKVGVAYQYQHLGQGEITSSDYQVFRPNGQYDSNRVHFVTLSYRY
ncbi:outer membrane protein transport protein [Vibrio sp. SCSIO 43140]|uniref:OmpP1/FadL family transporter n=1 Tax=Vibrio sp. SCSIO 43140 TaxID=2819100 RepID=UPI0020752191|nr:outer membrane protein transport protein [Vibrio sp. SCSIO 43140]USD62823.1 outer membrane protein transport protein [Vibrio sp. SCSIO 43140]